MYYILFNITICIDNSLKNVYSWIILSNCDD